MTIKQFERVNHYMSIEKEEIIICLAWFITGFLAGTIINSAIVRENYLRESLEGYRAVALYETNAVGEVKIKQIKWKKP